MISLILARGGSKGIPRKNIKLLNGMPLIYYPINAAKNSKLIKNVYVSTDDEEISEISSQLGARVIKRPQSISGDHSTDVEAFRHFCLETGYYKPIIHLRATTPILDPSVIDEAITTFNNNKADITSLRSGHKMSESAFKCLLKGEKYWEPIVDGFDFNAPRQLCKDTYSANGYIDIVDPTVFMNHDTFYGDRIFPFVTAFSPEIDTLDDFYYIEFLINKNV